MLFIAATFYVLVGNWIELQILSDVLDGEAVHANRFDELAQRTAHERLVFLGSWLTTAVFFVFFIGRTLRVASASGSVGVSYTPRWVFWSFFIPIVSLVVPYRAMQEAWRATDPEADSTSWEQSSSSWLIRMWWLQWLAVSMLGYATSWFVDATEASPVVQHAAMQRTIAFNLLFLTLSVTALLMVRAIAQRSVAKWEQHHGPGSMPKATIESE